MHASIPLPPAEECLYRENLSIRISDINYGGHMGHDRILSYCHEVRVNYLKALNGSEQDFLGAGLIMRDSSTLYKAEGFQGDRITIELYADNFWAYGFRFIYSLKRQSDSREMARVQTGMIYYDYTEGKKVKQKADVQSHFSTVSPQVPQ